MAKPKFELTTDLIKVEPEPQIEGQRFQSSIHQTSANTIAVQSNKAESQIEALSTDFSQLQAAQLSKEERVSISLFISKKLKKRFHLHCVENGQSMTEAIELAIQQYLEKKS